ncbi:ABC transporter substrate-binding protein [Alsobacter sp. SYSU BS001988]
MSKPLSAALIALMMSGSSAFASCAFKNEVPVKAYFAAFPAWKIIAEAMKECGNVSAELDQEIRTKGPAAFAANPALYHVGYVHNGTIVPLLTQGTIRPLDSLVAKYGQHLRPNQIIQIDGKVMAIALMVNTQYLQYRKDIFDKLNITVPDTYDDVLAAAKTIKESGLVQYPLGGTMKADWNIGIEFNNIYAGYGGKLVNADNSPALNSEAGVKTLEMLKKLSEYMSPEYLTADATFVQQQFQQEKIAMAVFWATRAAALENPKESRVAGKMATAAAPRAVKGGIPAVTYSWDAIAIAKNATDAEAEAAFRVALEGADAETVAKNNDAAVWLVDGYKPGPSAKGAVETLENGAQPAPSTVWRGLIDTAISSNVADYLLGKRTAEQTLAKMEADYLVAAKEAGLLKR